MPCCKGQGASQLHENGLGLGKAAVSFFLLTQRHLSLRIFVCEHHIAEGLKDLGNVFSFLRFRASFLVISEEKRGFGISKNLLCENIGEVLFLLQ